MHKDPSVAGPVWLQYRKDGFLIQLAIRSGAKVTRAEGVFDTRLKLHVAAPPIEGRANLTITHVIADALGVPKTHVRLVSGLKSKQKTVFVERLDLPLEQVVTALEGLGH